MLGAYRAVNRIDHQEQDALALWEPTVPEIGRKNEVLDVTILIGSTLEGMPRYENPWNMALHVSFKPGKKQSIDAACYFNSAAEEAMDRVLETLSPWQYLISLQDGSSIRLRIWSDQELDETELEDLLDHLRQLHKDVASLVGSLKDEARLVQVVESWLAFEHSGRAFFLEQWDANTTTDSGTDPELSFGVMAGQVVMISTNSLMFSQLRDDVFGLSIALKGSYLLERRMGARSDQEFFRRA